MERGPSVTGRVVSNALPFNHCCPLEYETALGCIRLTQHATSCALTERRPSSRIINTVLRARRSVAVLVVQAWFSRFSQCVLRSTSLILPMLHKTGGLDHHLTRAGGHDEEQRMCGIFSTMIDVPRIEEVGHDLQKENTVFWRACFGPL